MRERSRERSRERRGEEMGVERKGVKRQKGRRASLLPTEAKQKQIQDVAPCQKAEVRRHKMWRPTLIPYKGNKLVTPAELAENLEKSGPNPSLGLMAHLASCWL